MKCIILAAGYATRLYPLTENYPKPLLPVGEKTIMDWLVDDLRPVIDDFFVVTNHRFAPMFVEWAEKKKGTEENKDIRITVLNDGTSTNETRLGAVRDIQFAANILTSMEDCVVMAGDNVLDFSLKGFINYARVCGTSCVMYHEENRLSALQKTAVITITEDGLITSYEEKPKNPKGNLAVPPFYYFRASDICRIQEALDDGCDKDAPGSFAAWLSSRLPMHAYRMQGKRYDIGDIESYEAVRQGIDQAR